MKFVMVLSIATLFAPCIARSEEYESNYPNRKAIILNTCPYVELSGFSYQNKFAEGRTRFQTTMSWKNIGAQPLTAFEIVIVKYDVFDRRLIGERWTVTGINSGDWRPLPPGAGSGDGTIAMGLESVFTAIAYIRTARLADSTVWTVNDSQLGIDFRKVIPGIKDFGDLRPDPKAK